MPKPTARSTGTSTSAQAGPGPAKPGPRASGIPATKSAPSDATAPYAGIRVLCVDDHAVLVEGLRAQFNIEDRIRIVGSLATAANLLEETARLHPDVVLLDVEMPGPDVFEMADRLRHMHPRVRFIFLSAHVRDGYLAAAYKCGACGYVAKGDELEHIVAAVTEVARSVAGTFVMGPKVRAHCHPGRARKGRTVGDQDAHVDDGAEPATPLSSLSLREVEVLRLVGKGLSRRQIAAQLSRSVKTIDGHQERMMKKLRITSRADLMRFAIREGFAEA